MLAYCEQWGFEGDYETKRDEIQQRAYKCPRCGEVLDITLWLSHRTFEALGKVQRILKSLHGKSTEIEKAEKTVWLRLASHNGGRADIAVSDLEIKVRCLLYALDVIADVVSKDE